MSPIFTRHPQQRFAGRDGYALIVVLAFVVLVTGVIMAFFSRAVTERRVSDSSASQTKVELFADGAADTVVSDLKQEIAAGSTAYGNITVDGSTFPVYRPNAPATAAPALALQGNSSISSFAPNLVKRSANNQPFYSGGNYSTAGQPAAPDRAAPVSSTSQSQNGRAITPARWNKPLLLPKANTGNDTDLTPDSAAFASPDWILVGRDGSNPKTLADATADTSAVIGRYAYAIYDEGGILDANAVGYPKALGGSDVSYKDNIAFADLTQLQDASGNRLLLDSDINALVGWRNYASANAAGDLQSGYTFSSNASYKSFATSNPKSFLTVSGNMSNGQGDKAFTGRQELIDFFTQGIAKTAADRARLQNALQYLGTFTRDLNQPSFAPDPTRPKILSNNATANYAGNDAYQHDDDANPPFLSVSVNATFTRNDGTTARPGEPLLKKRFNLNRLAWLTYQGPSAGRNISDADMQALQAAGITQAFLQQGTTENIQKYFGLTWNPANKYWTYAHGIVGSGGTPIIGYLAKVRDAGREPDFFELLKTFINAGSVAKGATKPAGALEEKSAYIYDTKLDYAVLQIGANIIDQFKVDGFPTRIRFNDGKVIEFRGVQNLPYLYKMLQGTIVHQPPNPVDASTTTSPADLTDTGFYSILWEPEIWNPHDLSSSLGNPRPTDFRIVADGAPLDADGNPLSGVQYNTSQCDTTSIGGLAKTLNTAKTPQSWAKDNNAPTSYQIQWTGDNTALTFTDNGGALFREPTILAKPGIPNTSNLALGPNNLIKTLFQQSGLTQYALPSAGNMQGIKCTNDINDSTGQTPYLGFYYGNGPLAWVNAAGDTVEWAQYGNPKATSPSGSTANTFRLQYSPDGGTTWITYDEKYVPIFSNVYPAFSANKTEKTINRDHSAYSAIGTFPALSVDPRTRRFGFLAAQTGNNEQVLQNPRDLSVSLISSTPPPESGTPKNTRWIDVNNNVVMTDRWSSSQGFGPAGSTVATIKCFPAVGGWTLTSGPAYCPGLISQNNASSISGFSSYYTDADNQLRPAMGAYVTANSTTIGLPMARTAGYNSGNYTIPPNQSQSRPIILHRPFRSVAELGYVFSGTPWKNLNMFTKESGDAALLDLFCVEPDDSKSDALVAGKVNLNTRQQPVLQAVLAGAYTDTLNTTSSNATFLVNEAPAIARSLVDRTSGNATAGTAPLPLANIAELVGRWNTTNASYSGFSGDLSAVWGSGGITPNLTYNNIQRFRESSIRALANAGTARVWNLMVDLVAQTGRYASNAGDLSKFIVEGERRYWLHISIDRATGRIIDRQLEVIKE